MFTRHFFRFSVCACLLVCAVFLAGAHDAFAQTPTTTTARPQMPMLPDVAPSTPPDAARNSELSCGGFIEVSPQTPRFEIVGGEEEQEQNVYSRGDTIFINAGSADGAAVGQEFAVVRPRGQFKTNLSRKRGFLGVYTQEVGWVRITQVKERVSIAEITRSCETILLGDFLRVTTKNPSSPQARSEIALERFTDANGKPQGRIVLARDGREMISRDQVIFVDLGAEDGIKPGDFLTLFRPIGTGNLTRGTDEEVTTTASGGFESDRFRGGKFSNQAQRVKRPNETGVYGPTVSTPDIKRRRPQLPRKVVGEAVVVGVQQRTATVVITRVAQEVHTGDYVEVQ